jgi:hypothetical protein
VAKLRIIVGSATLTILLSMVERNTPMATRKKKCQGLDAEAAGWDIDKKEKRLKKTIQRRLFQCRVSQQTEDSIPYLEAVIKFQIQLITYKSKGKRRSSALRHHPFPASKIFLQKNNQEAI